jgi:16S rRNA (guanine1207-N2)-methyltransferase
MGDHYFSAVPSAPSKPVTIELRLLDMELDLLADRGVFSGGRVDPGTLVLLKEAPPPPNAGDLLDLGCGYGPIACALARRSPAARVWAIDVNSRALELTAANAAANGLANVSVVLPRDVPASIVFSSIWSNPPVRVGKEALHDLLSTWLRRMGRDASAWLVVNRHLGSDSLAGWLEGGGWAVRRQASKSGYRVLQVQRQKGPGDEFGEELGEKSGAKLGDKLDAEVQE